MFKWNDASPMLRVLSFGAGTQSSRLLLGYERGDFEDRIDCAIFADTQEEPAEVMRWLEWIKAQTKIPIFVATAGSLWKSASKVRTSATGTKYLETAIPVFTVNGLKKGQGQRHCTLDFKIAVVQKQIRKLIGLSRITAKTPIVEMVIGISTDEAHRMKHSVTPWIKNVYPLIEHNESRDDCYAWMARNGYPEPPRSACKFCPFRSDEQWLALPKDEFDECAARELELQAAYRATEGALTSVPYFHASRVPLSEVKFTTGKGKNELNKFGNECEGMCGV
jgi:hypothetical protein